MTPYQWLWLAAFTKTQLIEVAVGLLLLVTLNARGRLSSPFVWGRDALVLFLASAITHPPLWFILPRLCKQWGLSYEAYVALGEALVVLMEGLWYQASLRPLEGRIGRALLLSVALNTMSYAVGLLT